MPRPSEVKYRRGKVRGREKGWCDKKVSDDSCIWQEGDSVDDSCKWQEGDSVDACNLWKCITGFLKRKRDRQIAGRRRGRCLCVAVVAEPYHDSLSKTRPLSTHTLTLLCPCTVSQASWDVTHWSTGPTVPRLLEWSVDLSLPFVDGTRLHNDVSFY